MDLLHLGTQSRKTGIRPKKNLRKDRYNMEDIDEFFSEDGNEGDVTTTNTATRSSSSRSRGSKGKDIGSRRASGRRSSGTKANTDHNRSASIEDDAIIARKINFTDAETDKFDLSPISISKSKGPPSKSPLLNEEKPKPKIRGNKNEGSVSSPTLRRTKELNYNENSNDDGSPILDLPSLFVNNDLGRDEMNFDDLNNDILNTEPEFQENELVLDSLSPPHSNVPSDSEGTRDEQRDEQETRTPIKKRKASSLTKNMALGRGSKSRPKVSANKFVDDEPRSREISVKPSPLPSPPPDGLRRSRRTRIQPLAFWRGERIVYTRADEYDQDPDSTLVSDIKKIPLQEIKEIIHVPAPSSVNNQSRKTRRSRSKTTSRSNSQSHQDSKKPKLGLNLSQAVKNNNENAIDDDNDNYDYESDPEVEGSEWFKDKQLKLDVFENNDSESLVNQSIAFTPDVKKILTEPPKSKDSEIDNYKIAKIFDDSNSNKLAVAIMEFPHEGFKSSKSSGNCIYMFHVIKGLLEITLSNHTFVVTRGCSFQVPSGNTYGITNIGNGPGKVFCVQVMDEE